MSKLANNTLRPLLFWEGFPSCGLLVQQVVKRYPNLILVATRASVPFDTLESYLDHPIVWLDSPNDIWDRRFEFSDRNLVIHTGWNHSGWLRFDRFIKKKNNAKVVVVSDNRFRGDIRQYAGSLYFRLFLSTLFDSVFVPGRSGRTLMEFFGVSPTRIFSPNYGAFEGIYRCTTPITERPREFLFAGSLTERKGFDVLLDAFHRYRSSGGTWNLRVLGDGPLASRASLPGIILEGFLQPRGVASRMNSSRVLVLPSRDDNWGTVVCEAAACGMHIITTRFAGAHLDLVRPESNGSVLSSLNAHSLAHTLHRYESFSPSFLLEGSKLSQSLALGFTSHSYLLAFESIVDTFFI